MPGLTLAAQLWSAVAYALPFLAVLCAITFIHEFGHFFLARLCGAKVEVFSVGMGPEIVGRTDRQGARWRLSAIPVGGYVRFAGDRNGFESVPMPGALDSLPLLSRAAIVAAGPIANMIAAIALFSAI